MKKKLIYPMIVLLLILSACSSNKNSIEKILKPYDGRTFVGKIDDLYLDQDLGSKITAIDVYYIEDNKIKVTMWAGTIDEENDKFYTYDVFNGEQSDNDNILPKNIIEHEKALNEFYIPLGYEDYFVSSYVNIDSESVKTFANILRISRNNDKDLPVVIQSITTGGDLRIKTENLSNIKKKDIIDKLKEFDIDNYKIKGYEPVLQPEEFDYQGLINKLKNAEVIKVK